MNSRIFTSADVAPIAVIELEIAILSVLIVYVFGGLTSFSFEGFSISLAMIADLCLNGLCLFLYIEGKVISKFAEK